jgi:7-cyano-7-deazaguanine synthase
MRTAVLLSGGLDSAVLLAEEAQHRDDTQPVFVSAGLAWETAERAFVDALLRRPPVAGRVRPLVSLAVDMRDVYPAGHWAVTGNPPAYHTPDADVYLPGRNVVLLAKTSIYCAVAQLDRIVIGTLAHNPFPDATPAFRDSIAHAISLGVGRSIVIDAPFADMEKGAVVRRGLALGVPFDLTLSCMEPREPREPREPWIHCGTCSKCRERHDGFVAAGIPDPTAYADSRYVRENTT